MNDDVLFGEEIDRIAGRRAQCVDGLELRTVQVDVVGEPTAAIRRAREVLVPVLSNLPIDWPSNVQEPFPSLDAWTKILPGWFVDLCAPEMSEAKTTATSWRLHRLPDGIRDLVSHHTAPSLGAWISCFEAYRSWIWWEVDVGDGGYGLRYAVFDDVYTRWDLSWLLIASGAWRLSY